MDLIYMLITIFHIYDVDSIIYNNIKIMPIITQF